MHVVQVIRSAGTSGIVKNVLEVDVSGWAGDATSSAFNHLNPSLFGTPSQFPSSQRPHCQKSFLFSSTSNLLHHYFQASSQFCLGITTLVFPQVIIIPVL